MPHITYGKGLLMNLNQEIQRGSLAYLTQEQALEQLKKWIGQDFGYDTQLWKEWIFSHPELKRLY